MKKTFIIFLVLCSQTLMNHALAVNTPIRPHFSGTFDCTSTIFHPLPYSELSTMKIEEVEKKLNRSLELKEKLTFKLLKRFYKKDALKSLMADDCTILERKAGNSLLFGLLGLLIAGIIFGILAISAGSKAVKLAKANPTCPDAERKRKKGTAGIVLGVIDIIGAFFVLLFLL